MRAATARFSLPCSSLLLTVLVLGLLEPRLAAAATGDVLSFVKHSSTSVPAFPFALANIDELGGTAVGLGDLDGPGGSKYAVAVGAALTDSAATPDKGAVYVLFLNASGAITASTKIGPGSGGFAGPIDAVDEFGTSIAFLGDLDGAGPSAGAIAVGAPGDDDGAGDAGAVYILFLSSTGNVLSQRKISRLSGGLTATIDGLDELGGSVAWLGDMDGPGRSAGTLAVGAAGDDDGGTNRGAVHLLYLNANGTVFANRKISSLAGGFTGTLDAFDEFGSALANLQDLDGAGASVRALAIGAVFDDDGSADRGAVWITFLSDTGLVLSSTKLSSTTGNIGVTLETGDEFGGSLENLGDMDGVGGAVTTLAVCAAGDDDGGLDRGAVYLMHLLANGTVSSRSKISSTSGNFAGVLADFNNFGASLAFLGDLDGAGPSGVAIGVGASGDDSGGADRGAFYILFLSSPVTTDAPWDPTDGAPCVLGAASPNPFRAGTTIPFALGGDAGAQLEIHDLSGRLVRRFAASGARSIAWDGCDGAGRALPSGTYFVRLAKDGRALSRTGKAVLLR
jgi:hypothetical protein